MKKTVDAAHGDLPKVTMTTFSYTIELNDSERTMLYAALELLKNECDLQIANSQTAPYFAHLKSIASVQKKLEMGAQQMSGNTFDLATGLPSQFIHDIMLSIDEVKAGQVTAYKFGKSEP